MSDWPDPSELLPHAGPMRLIGPVIQHDAQSTTCSADLSQCRAFDDLDGVANIIATELMAQCAAMHAGLTQPADTPRGGFLAALQRVRLHVTCLPAEEVRVYVEQTWGGDGPLAAFTGKVYRDEQLLAEAELRVARAALPTDS